MGIQVTLYQALRSVKVPATDAEKATAEKSLVVARDLRRAQA